MTTFWADFFSRDDVAMASYILTFIAIGCCTCYAVIRLARIVYAALYLRTADGRQLRALASWGGVELAPRAPWFPLLILIGCVVWIIGQVQL